MYYYFSLSAIVFRSNLLYIPAARGWSLTVLDLWENQRGVSNVFLTYFDSFFGGQYKLGGLRGTRGGLTPPPPPQIEHWSLIGTLNLRPKSSHYFLLHLSLRLQSAYLYILCNKLYASHLHYHIDYGYCHVLIVFYGTVEHWKDLYSIYFQFIAFITGGQQLHIQRGMPHLARKISFSQIRKHRKTRFPPSWKHYSGQRKSGPYLNSSKYVTGGQLSVHVLSVPFAPHLVI